MTRHEVERGRTTALVRNVQHFCARRLLKNFTCQVWRTTRTRACKSNLAGFFLCCVHHILDIFPWQRRCGQHDQRQFGDHPDRCERLVRIVGHFFIKSRIDGLRAHISDEQGVSVRLGFRNELGAYTSGRTSPVFDNDRLSPFEGKLLRDESGTHVRTSARWKWHDNRDRSTGVGGR